MTPHVRSMHFYFGEFEPIRMPPDLDAALHCRFLLHNPPNDVTLGLLGLDFFQMQDFYAAAHVLSQIPKGSRVVVAELLAYAQKEIAAEK